jgi:hypothetical protein
LSLGLQTCKWCSLIDNDKDVAGALYQAKNDIFQQSLLPTDILKTYTQVTNEPELRGSSLNSMVEIQLMNKQGFSPSKLK